LAVTSVEFERVSKRFSKKDETGAHGSFYACKDLSFTVSPGERVAIVGETGSGKSTALGMLIGLERPSEGSVRLLDVNPAADEDALRGRVGIVFQKDRLLPWWTALRNVAFGLELLGVPRSEREHSARQWLARLGLSGYEAAYPHQLSGGMRQRVAIARAFAIDPDVLLADEAFTALDEITGARVREDLLRLILETGKTTVFVTHSVAEAVQLGQRILVFRKPGHVGAEIRVPGELREVDRRDIEEQVRSALRSAQGNAEPSASTR
jgi:NitT/TauT family transport system ATP-binding protein